VFTLRMLLTSNEFPFVFGTKPGTIVYNASRYHVTELFDKDYLGVFSLNSTIRVDVNPNGVYLIRVVPVTDDDTMDCT